MPAPVVEVFQGKSINQRQANVYNDSEYVVKKGDTLYSIAWISGNDYRDLARLNNISAPFEIYPGQVLQLKAARDKKQPATPSQSGQTTKSIVKKKVDPHVNQAYGESSKTAQKTSSKDVAKEFPPRVRRWQWPVDGVRPGRVKNGKLGNKGIDIIGQRGEDIFAAATGKVVYTGSALRGFGNLVIIKHSETFLSAYAHNEKIFVKEQQWVTAGQRIASMGSSGSNGVKLHFEVRYKGNSVDPLSYLPSN